MNLAALQTFLAINETGSLVRASEQLNVTQSTVTARLKTLEQTLGQQLFIRQKSGTQLTAAGMKLKRYAEAMIELWRQAQQETARPANIQSVCNLGCHLDLWPGPGRTLFNAIFNSQPMTALSAWQGGREQLDHWLASGLIDAALAFDPSSEEGRTTIPLGPIPLILVSSTQDSPIRFDPNYVYVDAGDAFARWHAATYSDAGTATITFGNALWALDHLLTNGGSGYLPQYLAQPHLESGCLHRLQDGPAYERATFLVTNDRSASNWPWLDDAVQTLTQSQGNRG